MKTANKNGHTQNHTITPAISTEMVVGNVIFVDLDLIDANPWQPRLHEDPAHVKSLAESIAANGLLQIPSARPHPTHAGRYQLAFGHSRKSAFEFLRDATDRSAKFTQMPLNIIKMGDQHMANAAAAENVARKDLSAIEIATAIQRYIQDFGATQIEAGKVYGYTSQSSVSNLLRLLQLPEPVRVLVNDGKLPERHARELITLGKAAPQAATNVARNYADAAGKCKDEDEISGAFDRMLRHAYDEQGVRFGDEARWDRAWPGKPITVESPKGGQPDSVPACKGCPFYVEHDNTYWQRCLRPKCFELKGRLWVQHALEAASKKLGIPIQQKGEETVIAYNGVDSILAPADAEKAIKAKDASLRIAPFALKKGQYDYTKRERANVLGFDVLMLTTTNGAALKKAFATKQDKQSEPETNWQRENRLRNERRKRNVKLCDLAAPHLAGALSVPDALIGALHEKCDYLSNDECAKWEARGIDARRADIMRMVLEKLTNADAYQDAPTEGKLIEKINELARSLKAKLPSDWHYEAIAVHVGKGKRGKK